MSVDMSKYMNEPTCPVEVGKSYYRTDLLECDDKYKVERIIQKERYKFYAICSYVDPFDDSITEEEIYAYYLSETQE